MRIKLKSRANLGCSLLWLFVAIAAMGTRRASRWGYPEMSVRGSSAVFFGLICAIVGLIYLWGSFEIQGSSRKASETPRDPK